MIKLLWLVVIFVLIAGVLVYFGYRKVRTIKFTGSSGTERTLGIIKPDAVSAGRTGKIIERIEQEGFEIIDMRKIQLGRDQAERFYAIHKGKGFFNELIDFMTSGPVVVMILEKVNSIKAWRELMGDTDPAKASEGTIRKLFGTDVGKNAVHGSDSPENAKKEIKFFFLGRIRF